MTTLEYIIGGLVLLFSVAIVWFVGAQQSKRKSGLSGSIAGNGASETYLSRNKIASKEASYKKLTLVIAIIFAVLVLVLYVVGSVDPKEETNDTAVTESSTVESSATESSAVESSASESSAVESSAVESSAVESSAVESSAVESSEASTSEAD